MINYREGEICRNLLKGLTMDEIQDARIKLSLLMDEFEARTGTKLKRFDYNE